MSCETIPLEMILSHSDMYRPVLLGVVGHDVVLDDLAVGGFDSDSVLARLVERSRHCQRLSLEPCDLQVIQFHSFI